jgi:hypothetical protein
MRSTFPPLQRGIHPAGEFHRWSPLWQASQRITSEAFHGREFEKSLSQLEIDLDTD